MTELTKGVRELVPDGLPSPVSLHRPLVLHKTKSVSSHFPFYMKEAAEMKGSDMRQVYR
jgi:hypothetical protein